MDEDKSVNGTRAACQGGMARGSNSVGKPSDLLLGAEQHVDPAPMDDEGIDETGAISQGGMPHGSDAVEKLDNPTSGVEQHVIIKALDKRLLDESHADEGSSDSENQSDYAAFRTITKFLHIIQRWPDLRRSNTKETNPVALPNNDKLVLKLCNSFAILSVIQHEVVAVGVGFHLNRVGDQAVEVLLTDQGLQKFDTLFNQNHRTTEKKEFEGPDGDEIHLPNPPEALKVAYGGDPSVDNLRDYLGKLRVTR